jgi:hypothetical protein
MTVIACSPEYAKLIGNLFVINPGYSPAMTMPAHPPGGQAAGSRLAIVHAMSQASVQEATGIRA